MVHMLVLAFVGVNTEFEVLSFVHDLAIWPASNLHLLCVFCVL